MGLKLHAFVIMPDHIHLLITREPEISLEKEMQFIKGAFSFRLKSKLDVWEQSFSNHRITDKHDYTTHLTYIPSIRLHPCPPILRAQEYAAPK